MTIRIGDRLPDASFTIMGESGPEQKSTAEVFGARKVLLFAVPGAFTPTCHLNHMPGYVDLVDEFRARGIDELACVAVNDVFVLDRWAAESRAKGSIRMLADGNADFVRAIGLDLDASGFGFGIRAQRFAMLVEDGTVKVLEVEPNPGAVGDSGAEAMLARIQ